jgi:hypothetical protein
MGNTEPKKSEKRQRDRQVKIRCDDDEFEAISANADRAGLSLAGYARAAMLGDAGPRARRRRPADQAALLQILGQVGRIGGNVNQIAKQLNKRDKLRVPELRNALKAYLAIRAAIYEALGMNAR